MVENKEMCDMSIPSFLTQESIVGKSESKCDNVLIDLEVHEESMIFGKSLNDEAGKIPEFIDFQLLS